MRSLRILMLACCFTSMAAHALDSVPKSEYHQRRVALATEMKSSGVAVLFAAEEPVLDFMPYRQDEDFYYLSGWNEPGAAMVIIPAAEAVAETPGTALGGRAAQAYREILFLPTRNPRTEKYTGTKMDANTPGVAASTGFDEVLPMTALPEVLNKLVAGDRQRMRHIFTQRDSPHAHALAEFTAATLGMGATPDTHDVADLTTPLRAIKSPAEIDLLRKASNASIAAQFAEMKAIHPGVTERKVAGVIIEKLMEEGCERVSYAPIVGSGKNSATLHYGDNSATMKSGDVVLIDAAGEYSMYASDITRTMPVNGHFTPRQRELYDVVLGAQRAAAAAFVAGKSKINDPQHKESDSLDQAAYAYINSHGKDLHGQPLGQYMVHGLGHLVGIDVHDPWDYTKPLDKGMVFTIEPGIYLPEEGIGIRIEDVFYVDADGKLVDLIAELPHEAADVEAAMRH
ncbi:aminopeptidase P N-terminal domain-containing protein [Edaphobacter bradus]|uniref:aminopeptidase P N-terminal domain-containing protein n=1 Tax=Edaphobacter bradus TaxID=2259016 RepID=UPI0037BE72A1